MISAVQVRKALALLGWTPPMLAGRVVLTFDDVTMALDEVEIRSLGGLQLGVIHDVLHRAGVEFLAEVGVSGVRLRNPP